MAKLRYAMVCSSNQNRSMEAHGLLQQEGLKVESFGVGQRVKLPGLSLSEPNVYDFGTPYSAMRSDLRDKAEKYYERKGLLHMLERNSKIKEAPERWQDAERCFDVALTFEERIMDQLLDDMSKRKPEGIEPLLVINLDVTDNHEEAALAAPLILRLCNMIEDAEDALGVFDDIMQRFQAETGRSLLHGIAFYA